MNILHACLPEVYSVIERHCVGGLVGGRHYSLPDCHTGATIPLSEPKLHNNMAPMS